MPINFFDATCHTNSSRDKFGLCDDIPPPNIPAYIDEHDSSKWIGVVHNDMHKNVNFYAIDHCIPITRPDGNLEKRCDGMLHYVNTLIFVELKMRGSSGWLSVAREQLTTTIEKFEEDNKLSDFDKVEAYACNGLKPFAIQGNNTELQKFKNDTGLIMYGQPNIHI